MTAEEFVFALQKVRPSVSELIRQGLSKSIARELRNRHFFIRRRNPTRKTVYTDAVLELFRLWNPAKVQIGLIRFSSFPMKETSGMLIGAVEGDDLFIDEKKKEVFVEEYGAPGHILWYAAKDSSRLLDALIPLAQFLEDRGSEKFDFDDNNAAHRQALECAKLAGGRKYLDFYQMICGAR